MGPDELEMQIARAMLAEEKLTAAAERERVLCEEIAALREALEFMTEMENEYTYAHSREKIHERGITALALSSTQPKETT
jgi:hypothetical protein